MNQYTWDSSQVHIGFEPTEALLLFIVPSSQPPKWKEIPWLQEYPIFIRLVNIFCLDQLLKKNGRIIKKQHPAA